MKLQDLGLKTKPATKYFEGGYISFKTQNKDLSYKVVRVTKEKQFDVIGGKVPDQHHLDLLLKTKTFDDLKEFIEA